MIDIEIIPPPDKETIDCFVVNDECLPFEIYKNVMKKVPKLDRIKIKNKHYTFYKDTLYVIYAYKKVEN